MSFGYGISDAALLVQLAWRTVQGARQACGQYDELTREVTSLHRVLQRLHRELSKPDSPLNRVEDERREELDELSSGCEQILNVMNAIVTKYNMLPDNEKSGKRIWQKVKFGNGEMKDLAEIRLKLSAHTSALIMSLNLCSLGFQTRVEKQLNNVGGDLGGIRAKVDWIAANMTAKNGDGNGTVWTSYTNDDKTFWRELRRELVKEGYHSSVLHKHKNLLKEYVEELGSRGVFDNVSDEESSEEEVEEKARNGFETQDCALSNHGDGNLEDEDTEHTDSESASLDDVGSESDNSKDSGSEDSEPDESGYDEADTPRLEAEDEPEPTSDTVEPEQQSRNTISQEGPKFPKPVQIEELMDEEYAPNSHPNTFEARESDQDAEETEVDPSSSPREIDQDAQDTEANSGSPLQNAAPSQTTDPQSVSGSLTSAQPSEKL
jgi:hypothetical protein